MSGFEFDIPVEVIHPRRVEVVGREAATDFLKLVVRGPDRLSMRHHAGIIGHAAALSQIAGRAGGDDVRPAGPATARARDDVIKGQLIASAAIDALEAVAQEDVEAGDCG